MRHLLPGPSCRPLVAAASSLALLFAGTAAADEGMWPYNMAPRAEVKQKYGFELTDAWLEHAMLSSVRFNNGGSGSFVSKSGLVMTNHHVGSECIQKLSQKDPKADFLEEGFYAKTPAEELRCPDFELNQLRAIEDVTEKVEAAAKDKDTDTEKNAARKAAIASIEKACMEETGLRCDVVTLYAGGAYHLYQYKRYTDVRLVFAPEVDVAFFGGDPENFTYPRHCLDVAFFRVWKDEKPASIDHWLEFDPAGAKDGDLVFVSGHPGSTDRFAPVSKLKFLRDTRYPFVLQHLGKLRDRLAAFMKQGEAERRAARDDYFGIENAIKALTGYLDGLRDKRIWAQIEKREEALLNKVRALPDVKERTRLLEAWTKLEKANETLAGFYRQYYVTEGWLSPGSGPLGSRARHLLRLTEELSKPDGERLKEYRKSQLESLKLQLFSEAPIDEGLEIERLTFQLEAMSEVLGAKNELVQKALAGKTPRARAEEVVKGTRVDEVAFRKELFEGGKAAVDAAKDPYIELLRSIDKTARFIHKRYEDEVEAVELEFSGRIAEAWAKAYGTSIYPDATFTLRLNHGVVKGYLDGEKEIPWRTQLGGLYVKHKRNQGKAPYELPKRWLDAMAKVDFSVPYNFVSTNDIIGGNSGSPVISKEGKVVGLIFDGNLSQLPNRFLYTDEKARAVSVHTAGIVHALERVYGARALVRELVPPAGKTAASR